MQIKGKTVLVTGASSGLGRAIAIAFAKEGANVAFTFRSDKNGADLTQKEIENHGVKVNSYSVELSQEKEVAELFNNVGEDFKGLDILVNNAGKARPMFLKDSKEEDWILAFKENVLSMAMCSKYATSLMSQNKADNKKLKGKIINMSSINATRNTGREGNVIYSAMKAAVDNFTSTLIKDVSPEILVNAVAPGPVMTKAWGDVPENRQKQIANDMYIKRWVEPEEIADAFVFVAKNDAVNGEVIMVDGGISASSLYK